MKKNKILFFGYLGLLASIMVGAGEFMIHFAPGGFDTGVPYGYFLSIPPERLTLGHWLLVPFLSFYIFGYWHLYLALKPG